jgi:predicted acetyltransferase
MAGGVVGHEVREVRPDILDAEDVDEPAGGQRPRPAEGGHAVVPHVEAALGARTYAEAESVVLEVTDSFCPWNEGRYQLPGGDRTEVEPDLRVDVTTLGSVYLGGFTFAALARALRLEELSPGAIARADTLFRVDRAPWCPEIF